MTSIRIRAGILIGVSALFISCERSPPKDPDLSVLSARPSGEELYVSGPDRLTMSEFEALRMRYPKVSPDNLIRIALHSQWLMRSWRAPGVSGNALQDATQCVRAVHEPLPDAEALRAAESVLSRAFGISSREELSRRLLASRAERRVEWNAGLAREYGFTPWGN